MEDLPIMEIPSQSFDTDIDIVTRTMIEVDIEESSNDEAKRKYGIL